MEIHSKNSFCFLHFIMKNQNKLNFVQVMDFLIFTCDLAWGGGGGGGREVQRIALKCLYFPCKYDMVFNHSF